jgi:hypothetical protein
MIGAITPQIPLIETETIRPPEPVAHSAPASLASSDDGFALSMAMEVLESKMETRQAAQSAQISLIHTALEFARSMAGQIVSMAEITGSHAYEAAAASLETPAQTIDTVT